jgi:Protein of unknown function (DUF3303)
MKKLLIALVSCFVISLAVTKATAADADQKLNTYLVSWNLDQSSRMTVSKAFSGMNTADDAAVEKKYGIHLIGRWHSISDGTGIAVVESSSVDAVNAWLLNWVPFMSIKVIPVLNDADVRKVISAYISDQDTKK